MKTGCKSSSILYFLEKEGKIIEPAGILSIDALKDYKGKIKEKNVVCAEEAPFGSMPIIFIFGYIFFAS